MEFEQTPPAIEQGKRFIEVNPDTAKGIEAMKQLDEAFIDLKEWIEDVWGCNDYPYYRQAVDKWLAVNKWGMEVLATLIKGTLDATDFKSI